MLGFNCIVYCFNLIYKLEFKNFNIIGIRLELCQTSFLNFIKNINFILVLNYWNQFSILIFK